MTPRPQDGSKPRAAGVAHVTRDMLPEPFAGPASAGVNLWTGPGSAVSRSRPRERGDQP